MSTATLGVPRRRVLGHLAEFRLAGLKLVAAAALVWFIVCTVGWLVTRPLTGRGFTHWEGGVDRLLAGHRTATLNAITNVVTLAGDTPAVIGVAAVSFVTLRLTTRRWRCSLAVLATMIGEVVIFWFTTIAIDRPRPTVAHLDGSPPTSSFPSGHTAASTSIYGLLAVITASRLTGSRWRALVFTAATLVVVAIGLSRLYRGMHYPSDILGGILLGVLWLAVTTRIVLRGAHMRETAPFLVPTSRRGVPDVRRG